MTWPSPLAVASADPSGGKAASTTSPPSGSSAGHALHPQEPENQVTISKSLPATLGSSCPATSHTQLSQSLPGASHTDGVASTHSKGENVKFEVCFNKQMLSQFLLELLGMETREFPLKLF